MISRLATAVLFLILLGSVAFGGTARDITSAEAKKIMDRQKNIYLLDVRSPGERKQGYIPGSVFIPIDEVGSRLVEVPRNRPVIVYCAVGSRSRAVAQGLANMGYPEVYNMRDGIYGWHRNGLPVSQ